MDKAERKGSTTDGRIDRGASSCTKGGREKCEKKFNARSCVRLLGELQSTPRCEIENYSNDYSTFFLPLL